MNTDLTIEHLLNWRMDAAAGAAPPPPRAARLLAGSRPWWERWPARFEHLSERLCGMEAGYGYAATADPPPLGGCLLPTLIVQVREEVETSARLLYLQVRDGRLRLRFLVDAALAPIEGDLEATFIGESDGRPLFVAPVIASPGREFRIDTPVDESIASRWEALKVTDRMPFRLILQVGGAAGDFSV